jgi:hypothetical protein
MTELVMSLSKMREVRDMCEKQAFIDRTREFILGIMVELATTSKCEIRYRKGFDNKMSYRVGAERINDQDWQYIQHVFLMRKYKVFDLESSNQILICLD